MENIIKLLLGFAFIVLVGHLGYQVYAQANSPTYLKLKQDLGEVEAGNSKIQETNDLLKVKIEALRTDPRAIERKVRDELGMARPDEVIIMLKRPEDRQVEFEPKPVEDAT